MIGLSLSFDNRKIGEGEISMRWRTKVTCVIDAQTIYKIIIAVNTLIFIKLQQILFPGSRLNESKLFIINSFSLDILCLFPEQPFTNPPLTPNLQFLEVLQDILQN